MLSIIVARSKKRIQTFKIIISSSKNYICKCNKHILTWSLERYKETYLFRAALAAKKPPPVPDRLPPPGTAVAHAHLPYSEVHVLVRPLSKAQGLKNQFKLNQLPATPQGPGQVLFWSFCPLEPIKPIKTINGPAPTIITIHPRHKVEWNLS